MHVGTYNAESWLPSTFDQCIEKLPYIKSLGVSAVKLMPVNEFPDDRSWGYNPSDPYAIESAFGGPDGLKRFVKAFHENGIAVIIDVVHNHYGPNDMGDGLWQYDGWSQDGLGGIYFYNDWRAATPWGHTRPDYGRPEVRQFLLDNAAMWLEEVGADGLRWDATSYIRTAGGFDGDGSAGIADGWSLMRHMNDELNARFPGRIFIAEDMQHNASITLPTEHGGAGFQAQWDAAFVHAIRHAVISPSDETRSMAAVNSALAFRYNGSAFDRVVFTESHDEVANGKARVPEEIAPGKADSYFAKKRSTLGAAIVFTAPGIPMIFQGQEFLEDDWFRDDDPIDWSKKERFAGIFRLYKDLIGLRLNRGGYTRGLCGQNAEVFHLNPDQKLIAYHRWDAGGSGDDVVVVATSPTAPARPTPSAFRTGALLGACFNSDLRRYAAEFGNARCPT